MLRRWVAVSCMWLAVIAAGPLAAQDDPSPEKNAQYRSLIEKGLQEYALGHWPEARVFFGDAHALWPNARTLRGLGMTCYEERSYVEAVSYLEQALQSKVQPLTPKLASEAQAILAQARRFVSSAFIHMAPSSAQLSVDDQPAKLNADGAVQLNPGDHSLVASSPGYQTEQRTLRAAEGRDLHVEIELRSTDALQPSAAVVDAVQPSAPARYRLGGQSAAAAAALTALGVGGLATAWVFYALRDSLRVELWEFGLVAEQGFEQSKYNDFRMRGGVALGAAGVGAIALTLAQYFWLPDEAPVPTWAWVAGAVGGAAALGALGWALLGEHCDLSDQLAFCRSTLSDELFAPMIATQALPLLSLPIMYAVRPLVRVGQARVAVEAGAGVSLLWSGSF